MKKMPTLKGKGKGKGKTRFSGRKDLINDIKSLAKRFMEYNNLL
jgi:hypothetical protein